MAKGIVLVIDDEESIRNLLREMLSERGYEVCAVAGLEEARLAVVALHSAPDVAFVDVHLEHSNGLDVVLTLRSVPRLAGTTFVAISGDLVLTQEQAEAAGCAGFVPKPFREAAFQPYLP